MKIYEFCRMLGILLDNSIEAARECDEKAIHICFRNEYNRNRQVVVIENTYNNKNLDIDKIFEKGISGKKNHTGIGLWEVRQILSKNDNLNLHTTKDEKFFKQQLEIYY
jgi:two-component system sensor histidine kinase AgrC